ncbi:DNA primase [Moorellaceae bacterium AZ2]
MPAAFPEDVIEEIKAKVDITEVISEYVRLKKRGQNYVGLCPFHSEKTPSFTVSPSKGIFYCFGCGAGGDVIAFLMRQTGMTFPEAVTRLAERAGIKLEEVSGRGDPSSLRQEKERLYQIGALAARFYHRLLLQDPGAVRAREYLHRRRVSPEAVEKFELGYAPDSPTALVDYLRRQGFKAYEIARSGLSASRLPEGTRDRFRRRLMFPIKDYAGRVVGFGGRVLDNGEPKYLNTPETLLFQKGRHLYGLHLALPGIRRQGRAVVVEGYMDAIAAWQHGVDNVVATLGTALTPEQARELKRYASEVVIAYDADVAGRSAALRGLSVLGGIGLKVRILLLPEGKDPDEFLQARGGSAFQELIRDALPWLEFLIEQAVSGHNLSDPEECIAAVNEVVPYLAEVENAVEREAYVRLLSRRTGQSEVAIYQEIQKFKLKQDNLGKSRYTRNEAPKAAKITFSGPEVFLLAAYITEADLAHRIEAALGPDFWRLSPAKAIAGAARELRETDPGLEGEVLQKELLKRLEPEVQPYLARLALEAEGEPFNSEALERAIQAVRLQKLQEEIQTYQRELAAAEARGQGEQVKTLQAKILALAREIKFCKQEGGSFREGRGTKEARDD